MKEIKKITELHIWNLSNTLRVIEITPPLTDKIKEKLQRKFRNVETAASYYKTKTSYKKDFIKIRLYYLMKGKAPLDCMIPIDLLFLISNDMKISDNEVEENIKAISMKKGRVVIRNPKLPFKIDPVFVSFMSHLWWDGSGDSWCQSLEKRINRERFVAKANYILGNIENWKTDKKTVHIPYIFLKLFEVTFNMKPRDFIDNKFPDIIFDLPKEFRVAFFVSMIIDDGHINPDRIIIAHKNSKLLDIVKRLCKSLGYATSGPNYLSDKKGEWYNLIIKKQGIIKLHDDIEQLIRKYGKILDLGEKQRTFDLYIQKYRDKIKKRHHNILSPDNLFTKKAVEILKLLGSNTHTTPEVAKKLNYSSSTISRKMRLLRKTGLLYSFDKFDKTNPLYYHELSPLGRKVLSMINESNVNSLDVLTRKETRRIIELSLQGNKTYSYILKELGQIAKIYIQILKKEKILVEISKSEGYRIVEDHPLVKFYINYKNLPFEKLMKPITF